MFLRLLVSAVLLLAPTGAMAKNIVIANDDGLSSNVVALYLRGTPSGAPACAENPFAANVDAPGYLELAMLHEVFHGLGATAQCAPNHVSAGHVGDEARDLMYAGSQPWRPSWLDVGRNDYWGHGRADCTDVARSPFVAW